MIRRPNSTLGWFVFGLGLTLLTAVFVVSCAALAVRVMVP